jgi:transposase
MSKAGNVTGEGPGRRRFDETFRRHAVELSLRGDRTAKEVARELGISDWTLYRWRLKYAARPAAKVGKELPSSPEEMEQEIRQLRSEVVRLRERENILKKSLGILSETPESGMPRSKL